MADQIVEDPILKQRLSFRAGRDDDGSEVLHVEMWVDPGGGVTPHIHPAMEERFTVLEGEAQFLEGRSWRTAGPGETVVVPPGTRHAYRNRGKETAHVACEARPPSSLEEFLREVVELSRSGGLSRRALPRSLGGVLEAARIAHRHRAMVVLLFPPMPPPVLQRLIFPALARLGERRRLRGHSAAQA